MYGKVSWSDTRLTKNTACLVVVNIVKGFHVECFHACCPSSGSKQPVKQS